MPFVAKTTINPAIATPNEIKGNASLGRMPNKNAHRAPVQEPVKGSGIATKITKANLPHFSNFFSLFLLVREKSQIKKRLKK